MPALNYCRVHRVLSYICAALFTREGTATCFVSAQNLAGPQTGTDLNIPTSKEEQEEYLRWKREREEIDRERVARHKNSKGQWRRAWDMDKTENMYDFSEFRPRWADLMLMAFDKVNAQCFPLNHLDLEILHFLHCCQLSRKLLFFFFLSIFSPELNRGIRVEN